MNAPTEIIDALESLLYIFFSETPHNERTTFILCDNLVELCCKKRLMQKNIPFDKNTNFHQSLEKTKVPLKLSKKFKERHLLRNDMQHTKAIITVNRKQCADFIIDIQYLIEKFWSKYALVTVDQWVSCSLRLAKIYSSHGNLRMLKRFEENVFYLANWNEIDIEQNDNTKLLNIPKRKRLPKNNEIIIKLNSFNKLGTIVREFDHSIDQILDELEVEYKK